MKQLIAVLKDLINQYKLVIVLGAAVIFLTCTTLHQCNRANNIKNISDNNIVALTDTISYYKAKNGQIVAEKTLLLGDMSTLRLANEDLTQQLENMKVKKPESVVYIESGIDNSTHDTVWDNIFFDTSFVKNFAFNDEYRRLNGNVYFNKSKLGLSIVEDKVFVDYTMAIKDNKVYVVSSNPYVQYNEINGITLPSYKPRWALNIGPSLSYGYDFINKAFAPTVGVSLTFGYNILSFGKRY